MAAKRRDAKGNRQRREVAVANVSARPRVHVPWAAVTAFALVVVGWLAYSTSFAGVFIFDDEFAIKTNPNIRSVWPLTRSMSAPAENPVSARPVAALTLAISYALAPADAREVMGPGGPDAAPGTAERFLRNVWGYHFMNLALHVLAALALFGVVRRTLLTDRLRPQFGDASGPLALVVALVWLVHPINTDAVTYVTQRTELLLGLFCFLTLYCAIRAWDCTTGTEQESAILERSAGNGRPGERAATPGMTLNRGPLAASKRLWIAASILACALGMGSKQTMVVMPFVVVLWDWMFAPGEPKRAVRSRWLLYAGLAATGLIVVAVTFHERWPHSIGSNREGLTPWTHLLTQTGIIVHYLQLSLLPTPLVIDYDGWPLARSILAVAPYAAFLAVLAAVTVFAIVRRQPWGFVSAWFFALLGPSSSLLPLRFEIAAERRMYVALASIVVFVIIGCYMAGRSLLPRVIADARLRRTIGIVTASALVAGLVITFAVMTSARNRDYWSEERIWRDAVDKRPDNPRARLNYGVELSALRRYTEAEEQLREAVRLKDTSASAHGNLGSVLCTLGRLDEGVAQVERALALDPDYRPGYGNLAEAYGALGRRAQAAKYFALAADKEPDNPFLLSRLGWLLATSPEDSVRNGAKAVTVCEHAVRVTSRQDVMSLDTLAAAYAEVGRFDDAVATAREAFALASSQRDQANAAAVSDHLARYRAHQPFRETS